MSKHDLQARPIYHHKRESIEAHLSIVFAALASQPLDRTPNRLEHQEIRAHRPPLPHRDIRAGNHTLTAADPLPDDLHDVLATITTAAEAPSDSGRSGTAAEGTH